MSQQYPHPCTNCGLCCIAQVCPLGQAAMGIPKAGPCPALEWDPADPDASRCGLITNPSAYLTAKRLETLKGMDVAAILGSGQGCCISARVVYGGEVKDFASLPAPEKVKAVREARAGITDVVSR